MEIEKPITAEEAAKLVPSSPTANAVWRWMRRGVKARSGERVYLEHWRYGGKLYTSAEALVRFSAKLAEADGRYFQPPLAAARPQHIHRPQSRREREIATASQRLKQAGIV